MDYSWSAGLDLGEDCHCLVFTQSAFHSSRALCARVSVCGGTFRAAGVPSVRMKGYQGERGMGNAEWPLLHVARHLFVHHMTWSFFAYGRFGVGP